MAEGRGWENITVRLGSDYSGWLSYSFKGRQVGVIHKEPSPFDSHTNKYTVYCCPDSFGLGYRFLEEGRNPLEGTFKRLYPKDNNGRYSVMSEGDAVTGWFSDIISWIPKD